MSFDPEDTIVALATPPGRGAIGVVRLSGAEALSIAAALTARIAPLEPRRATLARLAPRAGWDGRREGTIDQVLVTWFPAPRSYTGQDIVEISGHGSPAVLRALIDGAAALGARPAGPGEFTLRAYLNGRLDLAQAEAVADLVEAVTPLQARAACDQLHGTLSTAIEELDTALREVVARTGASLDFPDEIYVNGFSTSLPAEVQMELVRSLPGLEGALMLRPGRSDANIGVMAYDLRHRAAWSRTGCSPLAPSTGYCCASTMRT